MERSPLPPPTVIAHRSDLPVLLSVPHSGRDYPDWLVNFSRAGRETLVSLEDPLVDRLAWRAVSAGHGAVVAVAPRAAIDCNRAANDVDHSIIAGVRPTAPGGRAPSGLGIIPSRTASHGRLWREPIAGEDYQRRVAEAHEPYHAAIAAGLEAIAERHGLAILLDCHSMPPRQGQAEVVIGNRHGRSASDWVAREASLIARRSGWTAELNVPYAGGYVVERHGRPNLGVHALQIEIDRRCYCAADLRSPGPGFDRAAHLIANLAAGLGEALVGSASVAAE